MRRKLLLIGWDAADWKVITPLLDSGRMPALESLVNGGVMGNIATLQPMLSPMLWTSIATGVRPFKHGILGFSEPDPQNGGVRSVTNLSRKKKAVWNILNQTGLKSNVIGWWPSHPPELVNGVMISNLFHKSTGSNSRIMPGSVYPKRLFKHITDLKVFPGDILPAQVLPFVADADKVDQSKDKRLSMIASTLAETSSIHNAATAVMQLEPWDFMAVYYDAIDHFGHGFMKYHPPRKPDISRTDFALYSNVVAGAYQFQDMMLDVMLKLAGDDTTVILLSDHGFHPDNLRPFRIPYEPAGPAVEHRPYGIFVMKGPGIRKDERIFGASILDVAPTVLSLFGLPVGADMDGKVLVQAFDNPPEIATVASWEDIAGNDGRHPDTALNPLESCEVMKQLIDLGYIENPGEDKQTAAAKTIAELNYNLSIDYRDAGMYYDALPILERLWCDNPDEVRFGSRLAHTYLVLNRLEQCRIVLNELTKKIKTRAIEAADELRALKEMLHKKQSPAESMILSKETSKETFKEELTADDLQKIQKLSAEALPGMYGIDYLTGALLLAEGNGGAALLLFQQLEKTVHASPQLQLHLGDAYLQMKEWKKAEQAFKKTVTLDPDSALAYLGLSRCYNSRRYSLDAADAAFSAIHLQFFNPRAHMLLGISLHRLGNRPRAIEAFNVALSQNPNMPEAHKRLAYIYRKSNRSLSEFHKKAEKEVRDNIRKRNAARKNGQYSYSCSLSGQTGNSGRHGDNNNDGADQTIPANGNSDNGRYITIVAGLPRSGTSMMMQMLKQGGHEMLTDNKRQADDDNPNGYFEYAKTISIHKHNSWICGNSNMALKVVSPLLKYLPCEEKYRVIVMERNLDEVIASQRRMLERNSATGYKGSGPTDEKMKVLFKKEELLAKSVLKKRSIPTLYISYNDALKNKNEIVKKINMFLDMKLDETKMSMVINSKLYRQRS